MVVGKANGGPVVEEMATTDGLAFGDDTSNKAHVVGAALGTDGQLVAWGYLEGQVDFGGGQIGDDTDDLAFVVKLTPTAITSSAARFPLRRTRSPMCAREPPVRRTFPAASGSRHPGEMRPSPMLRFRLCFVLAAPSCSSAASSTAA